MFYHKEFEWQRYHEMHPAHAVAAKNIKNAVYSVKKQKFWNNKKFWNKTLEKLLSKSMILMTFQTVCLDLIDAEKFDEAESVCNELRKRYPDQIDGIERMAMVYEARGENGKAAEYYMRTAEFMRSNPGFDKEGIQWALDKVKKLKS